MGGCRCSYKNCNVKTDGKTHMFHYPVFDKLRCHQWLLNAHKLDFLNLKVSQLKNRVICQHHFKDDNFMNYKKDKLTFDAIPTLDGPYCDSSQYEKNDEENMEAFPLILEVENENILYCDKRANYSVKYADFLTNSEISFVTSLNLDTKSNSNEENASRELKMGNNPVKPTQIERYSDKLVFQPNSNIQPNVLNNTAEPMVNISNNINNTTQFAEETPLKDIPKNKKSSINIKFPEPKLLKDNHVKSGSDNPVKKEPKVKIISQKRIDDPISIPKNLKLVSPSLVIKMPQKKAPQQEANCADLTVQSPQIVGDCLFKPLSEQYVVPLEFESQNQKTIMHTPQKDTITNNQSPRKQLAKHCFSTDKPKVSLLRSKISSQRIAAIEEKRKFNMKLRDMIETCLDKKSPIQNGKKTDLKSDGDANESKINRPTDCESQVGSYLSKKPELPSAQEYTIAYLDARMKRLENTLLNKIDQNTQKIIELKNSIVSPTPIKKINTTVQTHNNEESYKRHLYQEISKFLSPNSNSLVYEELFINKFSLEKANTPEVKRKRRKCR
ncbi:uncharacterized protein LOC119830865 [Zerene cesonia]|uniref:uncharacterized protein LOC119830865 n=1 Tax=Zerene cesonia TaxID=33412 RepID=UPI0018E511B4|nr:uncharacterized protein LOC119830865 [Zerene cesonia]